MRILFLAFRDPKNPHNGGGDIYINELAKGCVEQGHFVTFLSSRFKGSKPEEKVANLQVLRRGSKFTMFLTIFILYFSNLRGKYDLVVEEIIGGPRIPFFASLYMKEKIVGIIQQKHSILFREQFSLPVASFFSFLERLMVVFYRKNPVIVNSYKTKEDLRAIGYNSKNMHVVYPGLPKHFFECLGGDFSTRKSRVLCLTKIRSYKRIDLAIDAMKKVHEILPESELIIAGKTNEVDPKYEFELRKKILDFGIKGIHFEKDISEQRKIELLCSSRVLVLPSTLEGFGIVVIEANACGTPAITSDRVPAAANGKNAIVTPYSDVDSISNAIITLLSEEEKWRQLSEGSIRWAKQFAWSNSVNQFISVIESIEINQG
jgi:glycosyltransferase involved in cell wall biosynthesis